MMSGVTPKALAANGGPSRPEARDDFVEHQQDAVCVADLAQPLQVSLRRHEHARRPGDRLDETGGDRVAAIGIAEALQVVGEVFAVLRLAAGEPVLRPPGVPHVHDIGHADREDVPVLDHARQRYTAHVDAVIGALARDETLAPVVASGAVIRHADLQRGIHRFGARIGEENVVDRLRRNRGDHSGELEGARMAQIERRGVVVLQQLFVDGVGNLAPAVPGRYAEQAGRSVQHRAAPVVDQANAVALFHQPRFFLELAVRRERHPMFFERIRREIHIQTLQRGNFLPLPATPKTSSAAAGVCRRRGSLSRAYRDITMNPGKDQNPLESRRRFCASRVCYLEAAAVRGYRPG